MAENNTPPELNLEQILATLASLPQTTTPPAPPQQQFHAPGYPLVQQDAYYPPTQTATPYAPSDPRLPTRTPRPAIPSPKPTPTIDPATITEWKPALRCVTKLSTNPAFEPTIVRLIRDQERNVRDWEAGRQRLVEEQDAKRENERAHLAVLALPGVGGGMTPLRTAEVEAKELEEYDAKVYRVCGRMVESQGRELSGLGVPFFGVRPELLASEGGEATGEDGKKKITKKEVLELQRKMLNHLMEMYGD